MNLKFLPKKILITSLMCLSCLLTYCVSPSEVLNLIREKLPKLRDSNIGAIDSEGKYTKGSGRGLNCSGFAKWVIDGFYTPLTKDDEPKYMSIQTLRTKHFSERGKEETLPYEKTREPYFGLDWTRNMAMELGKKRGEDAKYKSYDITQSEVAEYVMNCGFPTDKIESVLLEQGKLKSNSIFLGSINGMFGKKPTLWQHYHVAVFVPHVENDELSIIVLERNKETSFEYLLKRYPNTYCHLVEITTQGEYSLMEP